MYCPILSLACSFPGLPSVCTAQPQMWQLHSIEMGRERWTVREEAETAPLGNLHKKVANFCCKN